MKQVVQRYDLINFKFCFYNFSSY